MEIIHFIQPTWNSCVSTCLAMILNEHPADIIRQFHDRFMAHETEIGGYLDEKGVPTTTGLATDRMDWDGVYLISVPSLNKQALMHLLVADTRADEVRVYDPNAGKPGKRYYIHGRHASSEYEVELASYFIDLKINQPGNNPHNYGVMP